MRIFALVRDTDETGISGTGIVAEGVEFSDGTCSMRWRTKTTSTAVYASIDDLMEIHGHEGKTRIVWEDRKHSRNGESWALLDKVEVGKPDYTFSWLERDVEVFERIAYEAIWRSMNTPTKVERPPVIC
jgi:hypothetical protein